MNCEHMNVQIVLPSKNFVTNFTGKFLFFISIDDLDMLESDPGAVRSLSYDLVLNGMELGGGSIRNSRDDIQRRVFTALGMSPTEAQAQFGFLLDAFKYGAPPHGGIAMGYDGNSMPVDQLWSSPNAVSADISR